MVEAMAWMINYISYKNYEVVLINMSRAVFMVIKIIYVSFYADSLWR